MGVSEKEKKENLGQSGVDTASGMDTAKAKNVDYVAQQGIPGLTVCMCVCVCACLYKHVCSVDSYYAISSRI